jgi:hypothetical protein
VIDAKGTTLCTERWGEGSAVLFVSGATDTDQRRKT